MLVFAGISCNHLKSQSFLKTQHMCDNAPNYSVTAWGGGSVVIYNGKCYRARTVGAAGHQAPWDNSTYNSISGWDEIQREEEPCSAFGKGCVDCSKKKCIECKSGWALDKDGNGCTEESTCGKFGPHCTDCSSKKCLECKSGFSINTNGKGCTELTGCGKFGPHCTDCSKKKCVECDKGFDLVNGKCEEEGPCKQWPNCVDCTSKKCVECARKFELTNKGTCTAAENHCEGISEWDRGIAFGQKAPWTYKAGDVVQYGGNKYKANWGGQETPGDRKCGSEGECRNAGIQWVLVEAC